MKRAEERVLHQIPGGCVVAMVGLLTLTTTVRAQTYVFGQATFATGASPVALVVGDFNGDGRLDLATANSGDNTVSILIGKPDGTFQPHVDYEVGASPSAITTGDFNGDGKLDLAVANRTDGTVSILLGNGDGTFQVAGHYEAASAPASIAVGDFNGDGKLDLAVANSGSNSVSILLGHGDGTFAAPVDYAVGSGPVSLVVGDFNNDGKPDVAVLNSGDLTFSLMLGKGDGTFGPAMTYSSGPAGSGATAMFAADFNRDGKLDIVVSVNSADFFSIIGVFLGNGDGTFQPEVYYGYGFTRAVAVGDFNRDGNLDILINPGEGTEPVATLLGGGDGTFGQSGEYLYGGGPYYPAVVVGDFNGDGGLDVAAADTGNNWVSVILGDFDGTFAGMSAAQIGTHYDSFGSMVVGDFNGDGNLDLAVPFSCAPPGCTSNTSAWYLMLGNGDGTFQEPFETDGPYSGSSPFIDFNGDGVADQAFLNASGEVLLLLGGGQTLLAPIYLSVLAAGDFNKDGIADLAGIAAPWDGRSGEFEVFLNLATIALYPNTLTFSPAAGGGASSQAVTISNPGLAPLKISSITATGDFTQTNNCISTFLSGATCTITVTSTLTEAGTTSTGSISITDNAPGSPHLISLTASIPSVPELSLAPASLSFANQQLSTTSARQTLTLSSTGNTSVTISSITASGDFAETNTCGTSVAAGASCTISVTFTPTAPGTRTGTITITDNAPGSPHIVSLTGTGLGPAVSFSASTVSTGGQVVGTTSGAHSVTLTNSGNAALTITGLTISPSSFSETNTCGSSLAAGASCTITVTFTPATSGPISGVLSIADNAPGSPQEVSLSGMGQDFDIGPYNLWQTIPPGASAPYALKLTPLGGFNQTVTLACSGAPAQSSCSVSPSSVTLNGFNYAAVELKVTTQGASSVPPMKNRPPGSPGLVRLPRVWLAAMFGIGLMMMAWSLRTFGPVRLRILAPLGVLLLLTVAWIACGGAPAFVYTPPSGGTPSGNYVITVTATSGHLSHAVTVKLTVE